MHRGTRREPGFCRELDGMDTKTGLFLKKSYSGSPSTFLAICHMMCSAADRSVPLLISLFFSISVTSFEDRCSFD